MPAQGRSSGFPAGVVLRMTLPFWEAVAVGCGLLYLILLVRGHVACWAFGIAASLITVFLYVDKKLYLEAVLNAYYVLAGVYGWWYWGRGGTVPVTEWSLNRHTAWLIACTILSLGAGILMSRYTDSPRPYIDAALTVFSFLATWMEARKVLSGWYYWFVINAVSVWLQWDRELYLFTAHSVLLTVLCVVGYFSWRKARQLEMTS